MPSYPGKFLYFREPIKRTNSASVTVITITEGKLNINYLTYELAVSLYICKIKSIINNY
jgi:hypothetical protein